MGWPFISSNFTTKASPVHKFGSVLFQYTKIQQGCDSIAPSYRKLHKVETISLLLWRAFTLLKQMRHLACPEGSGPVVQARQENAHLDSEGRKQWWLPTQTARVACCVTCSREPWDDQWSWPSFPHGSIKEFGGLPPLIETLSSFIIQADGQSRASRIYKDHF